MSLSFGSRLPSFNVLLLDGSLLGCPAHGVTLVHFWAMSCPACKMNMPYLQELRERYGPKGLRTVAVHMPRGPFDLDVEKVKKVATEIGITEPCAIDNEHEIGDTFGVDAWPAYFLFDAEGKLRRQAKGNFGVRMIEQALIRLFDNTIEGQTHEDMQQTTGLYTR